MNKIYKVIWSKVRNCYVAVSEIAKRNGKNRTSVNCGGKRILGHAGVALSATVGATLLAGVCSVLLPVRVALAAPVMPTLDYRGATADVTIASTSSDTSATMNISSTKTNNVMKWIDFSIGNGGTVQYDANNYLNYVTGHGRSEIDGALKGTGSIYLINPNGILFGSTAQVDVGNLYLSTRELDQSKLDAFAENGTNPLATAATSAAGDIVNLGTLNATNITVEGNNVSFKNVEEVTPATAVNVRASGEVHVGYAASEAVNEVNATQYTDGNITAPDLSKWSFTGLDSSAAVEPTQYMLVRNAFELQNMQNRKTKVSDRNYRIEGNYMLANDIDFNDVSFNFKPIGYSDNGSSETVHRFGGKFDGLNFRIRNLTITDATLEAVSTDEDPVDHNIGLFGVNSGLIENVGVENTNIDVTTYTVGGVVGWNTNGTIRNVYHTGNVKGTRAVGGIAGANQNYSLIETAYNTGNVVASDSNAGGIAGFNPGPSSNINNVYNTGSISSAGNSGGIVGQCSTGTTIENAYNTGTVAGRGTGVGGILGMNASTYNQGVAVHIKQTYNTGTVTNKNDDSSGGGIFGRSVLPSGSNVNIVSSYFSNGNDNGYGTLKTNADLHKIDTFEGWDISAEGGSGKTWRLYQGQNTSSTAYPYPLLTAFLKPKDLIKVYEYDGQPHTIDSYNDEIFNDINIKKGPVNSWIKIHVTNAGVLDYSSSANGQYDKRLFYSTQDGYDIADMKLIVQPKKLTATFADISKVYDRDTTATADTKSLSGKISGDTVDFADGITGVFADKNVGTNKDVTYSNIALTGASAGNYIIADTATGAGAITPKALTVSFANTDKTYDGNTTATPGDGTLSTAVIISGDTVTLDTSNISALYTDKNVGDNKTVNYSGIALGGADAGNYSIAETAEGKGTITAKELTVSFANTDKTYDGSTTATPGEGTLSTAGIISGDTVTLDTANMYALYADKNVGENKTVNYSGIALGGTDAGNYSIAETAEGKGTITAKALTVSFADISKTYDGNTNATPGTGTLSTDDIISGDTVTLDRANIAAAYASPTAGTGNKTVNYSGIALGGTDAGNYSIATTAQNTTSTISAKTLTVGNISKVYDSTAEAILTLNNLIGVVDGDAADLSISGVTANYTGDNAVDAGTGKTVDYSGLTLGGTKSVNYSIAANGTSTTGNEITARPLTMGSVSKVYDGTDHALVTVYALTNAIEDDLLDLGISATSATYSDKNVGDNLDVNYTGLSLSGAKAGNYTIDSDAAVTGNSITPKELTLVADKVTIKNGEAVPTSFTGNVIGFVGEEGLASQDDLKFELATPGATMAGSYAVIGMLKDSESGDYQANGVYSTDNTFKNYTFSNSPTNGKAFTIAVDVMPQLDYRGASADVTIDSATTANTMAISSIQLNNVLKWIDFSIGSGGTVQFDENNYLNYVTGHGRSEINGTLKGGGAIYLINPNGMLFGSDAQVNVGNLYLSSRSLAQSELDAFTVSGTNPFGTTVTAAVGDIANLGTLKAANITVEGNNVSFKNYADITATNNINVRASGEVHVGFANDATAATAINSTEYTTVNEPDLTNWNFKGLDNETSVTPVKYMLVRNAYELQNINNNLTGNYMLANDINFTKENGNWIIRYFKSLGSKGNYWGSQPGMFQGRLDGLNHVIRNINITNTNNESYSTDVGIIGSNAGIVENFGVVNGNIVLSSKSWVGGIVGANKGCGIIRNVYFSGLVEGNRNVGGIAGAQDGYNTQEGVDLPGGRIEKAYASGTVRSNSSNGGSNVGGIAGSNASGARISEAYNSANVSTKAGGNYIGGIAGTNSGTIINAYNTGTIEGGTYVGGIAGSNSSNGSIQNTYNTGTVSGTSDTSITGSIAGSGAVNSVSSSYFTVNYGNNIGKLINESELKKFDTFAGSSLAASKRWDMSKTGGAGTVWRIYEGQTGPLLTAFLKTKDVVTATEYNGSEQPFDNTLAQGIANHIYATDSGNLVKGTDAGRYLGNNTDPNNDTGYKVYYSDQGGYDIGDTILVIQPKKVAMNSISNVYDGNVDAIIAVTDLSGVLGTDTSGLTISATSAKFADKNVGENKVVTYSGLTLSGTKAENYIIAPSATGAGKIDKREISVAFGAISKTYDGLTTSDTIGARTFTNVIAADADKVDVTATATYDEKNAGNRTVDYSAIALTGDEANNYSLTNTTASSTGTINKRETGVSFGAISKTYDGLTTSDTIGARTFTNVIAADADKVDVTATATYDEKNAGNRTVDYSAIALTGD
ncbi:MAG: filamentous hemagglutinin N-terminal domain-containing protein, partial [Acidaminococcaceae bacterium]|nr:filamentous hemagglutinin N-terminal domain-containing protein [Acidaminococcaceae bacterium]